MSPVEAVAITLMSVGIGFGLPIFIGDLMEDVNHPIVKQRLSLVAFDLIIIVTLFATLVTMTKDILLRIQ